MYCYQPKKKIKTKNTFEMCIFECNKINLYVHSKCTFQYRNKHIINSHVERKTGL